MKFKIVQHGGERDGEIVHGFNEVGLGNVYIMAYGLLVSGHPPGQLEVGDSCVKRYSLSGERPTEYRIVRVS